MFRLVRRELPAPPVPPPRQIFRPQIPRGVSVSRPFRWAYGVTTVPSRRTDPLPRTLASLAAAGFDRPRLFVDGTDDVQGWAAEFGLDVTVRSTTVKTCANWVLAAWELYARDPLADRYAVFQDDLVASRNLRAYLEGCAFPPRGYLNLYTFPSNQGLAPAGGGWYPARLINGNRPGFQTGRGALGLVFDNEGLRTLLASPAFVGRFQDAHRGHKSLDGGVVHAMNTAGWTEYVHDPSLVQHTGHTSSMGNKVHPLATSFRGEDYDLLELLKDVTA